MVVMLLLAGDIELNCGPQLTKALTIQVTAGCMLVASSRDPKIIPSEESHMSLVLAGMLAPVVPLSTWRIIQPTDIISATDNTIRGC